MPDTTTGQEGGHLTCTVLMDRTAISRALIQEKRSFAKKQVLNVQSEDVCSSEEIQLCNLNFVYLDDASQKREHSM